MMGGLTLGPFSFSAGLLTTFAAIVVMMMVGSRVGRSRGVDVERQLWIVMGVAMLAARGVYVARFADAYMASPLGMVDIRDGGFSVAAAIIAAAASAMLLALRNRRHLKPLLLATGAGVAVFGAVALAELALPQRAPQLPQVTLSRLEGGSLSFGALAGKPVVLNLWASWCGPCRREMPVLRQAQLDNPDITFIFVNQGETPDAVRSYLATQRISLNNVVLDSGSQMAGTLGSKGLPTTFYFDRKGAMRARRVGEVSAATLAEQLESLK